MPRRQRSKLEPPAEEERVGSDHECIGTVADERREGGFDLAAVARPSHADLNADGGSRCRHLSGHDLGIAVVGIDQKSDPAALGTSSRNTPSCFAPSALLSWCTPVALPPGRAKLATRPTPTGSSGVLNTIGIVAVAAVAASAAGVVTAMITAARRCTSSAASPGRR